ncbi:Asp-tRNA(Asn)/Glu-tRNA(Gln) amidotransferase subunit GatC [Sediminibacterium ginsengisoli]|uniref:Aspartyl/glutamyl-tRNA(Asn/Gln) amidotransferase subunit C n=1 Tax=Sediminibacterium ginsengisoli TaxID=413434 RepID=A0A1T4N0A3_9BACT|nr:Asp-tRNA(Asn)/Glu-tRNA(Gln) amidotransferase subunit GatC [Sediminibacterium ginsengisoli]SJZ72729.1 aspartyl/glutamyl-tRNA(Asn/Gln) amidotransferase subunit C [Sediminibacterium ginsengisoli]
MEIASGTVAYLANLSRLHFNEDEQAVITDELQQMLAFVEKLQELDTTGVEPLMHMGDAVNVLREDKVAGSVTRAEALKNAPVHDEQFFKVPKVIRK